MQQPHPKEETKRKELKPQQEKRTVSTEPQTEEEKKDSSPNAEAAAAIVMVDAWTQTEKIDFARARSKMVMSRFGKSRYQRSLCKNNPLFDPHS